MRQEAQKGSACVCICIGFCLEIWTSNEHLFMLMGPSRGNEGVRLWSDTIATDNARTPQTTVSFSGNILHVRQRYEFYVYMSYMPVHLVTCKTNCIHLHTDPRNVCTNHSCLPICVKKRKICWTPIQTPVRTNNVSGQNVADLYTTCDKYQSNFYETELSI